MGESKKREHIAQKLILTQQLVKGLTAGEWQIIRGIIDHQYEEKATKLALDDLSCESIKKWFEMEFDRDSFAQDLQSALESTLKSNS